MVEDSFRLRIWLLLCCCQLWGSHASGRGWPGPGCSAAVEGVLGLGHVGCIGLLAQRAVKRGLGLCSSGHSLACQLALASLGPAGASRAFSERGVCGQHGCCTVCAADAVVRRCMADSSRPALHVQCASC